MILSCHQDVLKCRQVEPDDPREFTISQSEAFNCNANIDPLTYGDIGMIPHKNAPCVLDFLKQRYMKGQIYVRCVKRSADNSSSC